MKRKYAVTKNACIFTHVQNLKATEWTRFYPLADSVRFKSSSASSTYSSIGGHVQMMFLSPYTSSIRLVVGQILESGFRKGCLQNIKIIYSMKIYMDYKTLKVRTMKRFIRVTMSQIIFLRLRTLSKRFIMTHTPNTHQCLELSALKRP